MNPLTDALNHFAHREDRFPWVLVAAVPVVGFTVGAALVVVALSLGIGGTDINAPF